MNKQTVTAVTIIYNEEKLLDRCLSSVAGAVDKIMVFHDGPCNDQSLEIAKKYTDEIIILEHKGHIEAHMVDVLNRVETDWILILDADEYLPASLKKKMGDLINDPAADSYSFVEPIFVPEENRYTDEVSARRKNALLRVSKMSYVGLMHAGYLSSGNTIMLDDVLEHRPLKFNFTWKSVLTKWRKIAKHDAAGYFIKWQDVPKFNYSGPDLRLTIKKKIRFRLPLISMLIALPLNFSRAFIHATNITLFTFKYGSLFAVYEAMVCYYIFQIRFLKFFGK